MENVESLKKSLLVGTKLILIDDLLFEPDMPAGLIGTVESIDDSGNILVNWESGKAVSVTVDDSWVLYKDFCEN